MGSVRIVIAARNEASNIGRVVTIAQRYGDVLVVDNASIDDTARIAHDLGADVLLHKRDRGIAQSYIDGLRLSMDYDRVVQMDAGLSFSPYDIPRLLAVDAFLVIGVRQNKDRRPVSIAGSWFARRMTGTNYPDWTSGFRCWSGKLLQQMNFSSVKCKMHGFQIEMLWQAHVVCGFLNLDIAQVPVSYKKGRTSADLGTAMEALRAVWSLRS